MDFQEIEVFNQGSILQEMKWNCLVKLLILILAYKEAFTNYRHSSFNAVFGPRKNRVIGGVLKPQNGEYERSKSMFS